MEILISYLTNFLIVFRKKSSHDFLTFETCLLFGIERPSELTIHVSSLDYFVALEFFSNSLPLISVRPKESFVSVSKGL